MPKDKSFRSPQKLWESVSSKSVHIVEGLFFKLGVAVARHPWKTVLFTFSFVLLSCIGLLRFHIEKNPMNLWVPPESDFYYDTNWYIDTFGTGFRLQKVIITADNVLEPEVLSAINNITKKINSIQVKYKNEEYSLKELCYKVPIVNFYNAGRVKRSLEMLPENSAHSNTSASGVSDFSDPTLWVNDEFYCDFLESFQFTCYRLNILDLWKNNQEEINQATKHDIVEKINKIKVNPTSGHPYDYTKLFGAMKYDEHGDIISAGSIMLTWFTQVNMTNIDVNEVGNLVGTEDWVSIPLAMWESEFLDLMESISHNFSDINIYYEAGRSFADISGKAMFDELDKLFLGILLMFLYIQFALSRYNWLEIKLTLGSVGLLCVGLAYITAVSWCSVLGISFGPIHSSLPFLLMGLGIDDMFVMNACWNNLPDSAAKKTLPVKVGLMLKHAGVSIVITSFTDIVALLIGAITILPSLKSFCIYAAMGVFFIFCFSVTFYVAVFTLDLKRIEDNRNGILFCYQHKKQIRISDSKTVFQTFLEQFYKRVVFTIPGKIVVILFTLIITGFSIQAILHLEQRFDPKWFIPDDTYYKDFLNANEVYYPEEGNMAMVFLGEMNYNKEFIKIHDMIQELKKETYIYDVSTWVEHFHQYVLQNYNRDLVKNASALTDQEFNRHLSRFLYSPIGGRFQVNFKFAETFACGIPATQIKASTMLFNFAKFRGPEEYIPAMNHVRNIVKTTNITTGDGYRSVWSKVFANWVTDEIIAVEVERNIELALLCVMLCTVILITNLQMCLWIFVCVLLTILNVLGCMQRWGMTVDIVCCIGLELATGLCVDYAAHVGHTFLTLTEGSSSERAFKTVTSIGSAVMLGGGSTFLSLSLLSMSKAYTFQSFFKIFLLVILFGLFNGLIFLPVGLSLIGPDAYKPKKHKIAAEMVELNGNNGTIEKQLEDG
ncbi:protein patched homolog 1-like [Spodoptera frugiperda]|uniref:Protein patched homolog 1-like n=1 Tax=Spodoptera frugiperda TaxID=7108 RepID=A0A9R0EBM3_SPOFR|nr:protein patched homolog 1-like [Spodoptera frugiperda]